MKKLFVVLVAVALLFGVNSVRAEENAAAEEIQLSAESYTDFVLERELDSALVGEMQHNWYGVKLNIGIHDIITISPIVAGVGSIDGEGGLIDNAESDEALGLGVEAKLSVPNIEVIPVDLAVIGAYRGFNSDLENAAGISAITQRELEYREWSVEVQASKAIDLASLNEKLTGTLTPLLGIRYSDVSLDGNPTVGATTYDLNAEADDNVGITVGAAYDIGNFGVSVQGKLIDQEAIQIAGTIRF